ncbi:MAG: SusC/RagA family TonB-linked outer membrane protein [Cytophagales bacterium CG18_big_fil_WC_8_21_14_2_50_42_9]|nr:MAG: SusC/RagA family TonB-linked outer membrane protein [Cytophagales bacterium CG18_big_fil_WC_8_21_14_2_50_42_9]
MRRILKLCLLLAFCSIRFLSSAQLLLSSANNWKQPGKQQEKEVKALKEALTELEAKYQVSIMYNSDVIADKVVTDKKIKSKASKANAFESELDILLKTNGLKYDKVSDKLYVITAVLSKEAFAPSIKSERNAFESNQENIKHEAEPAMALTITGTVTSSKGETLPGVTVLVKGTSSGTTTDPNGNYTINVPDGQENGTLVFSFIGYTTQEVPINNRTTVNVTLGDDVKALEEVVVIGYQTVRKSDVTGAVSVVSAENANRVTASSVAESIQGLAPGVTVRNSGVPGQGAAIEIRGVASFNDTNPLYVIDGMIAEANVTINNNDIASIQILKDASAAAIYGSRAANGVIIITTKQGKEGPAKVSFSAKTGVQNISNRWDVMNSTEFAAMQRTMYTNSGATPPSSVAEGTFNPNINTNWQDEVLQTGSLQDYNLAVSGGTASTSYLISASYFKNEGYVKSNSFDRGSLRINTRSQKGRVTFGENLLLSHSVIKAPTDGNPIIDMAVMLPVIPVQDPSYITTTNPQGWGIGTTNAITYAYNPVAVRELSASTTNYGKLVGNAFADVKLFEWLNYRFNAGAEVSYDFDKNVRELGVWQYNASPYPSSVNEERSTFLSLLFEHTLNFNKQFGDHLINGVVGISSQQTSRETTIGGRTNLTTSGDNYFTTIGSATGEATSDGGTPTDYRTFGYLGRVNYSFKDRYLVTLTGRIDKDSRFGANYRTGYFPSIAASWRISQENFFHVNAISDLKINASYGKLGIIPTSLGSWPYTSYINNNPRVVFGADQGIYVGAYQATLANPDLRWEERTQQNLGLDASFFQNKLSFEFNIYNSLSKDVLLNLPVPGYLGNLGGNPYVNSASIRNKGLEVAATYRSQGSDLQWDISGNITTIKNTVENVGNQGQDVNYISSGNTRSQVGNPVGAWYILKTDGLFQSQAEIDSYTNADGVIIQPDAQPGDVKYIDQNDDGVIDTRDRVIAGSPWPSLQAGMQFNAAYKRFSLNVQLTGVFGNKIYNSVRYTLDAYQNTNFRSDINPWTPTNTDTEDPRIGLLAGDQGIAANNYSYTDRWLESGSYVRMRNLEIGYNLPQNLLDRAQIRNTRIYVSGQNLFTITKYTGLDPDVTGANIQERGLDNGHWPASRVISIGIQGEF